VWRALRAMLKTSALPATVEVGYRIYSISEIDTTACDTATVDLRLFFLWRDEALAGKGELDAGDDPQAFLEEHGLLFADRSERVGADGMRSAYYPLIDVSNALRTEEIDRGFRIMSNEGDVKMHVRLRVVCMQSLRFHAFPFDCHDIELKVRIPRKRDNSGVRFVVNTQYGAPRGTPGAKGNTIVKFDHPEWYIRIPAVDSLRSSPLFILA